MTGAQFRSFQETCPDHELWVLVKGTLMVSSRLTRLYEWLTIPACGLRCRVGAV